MGKATIELEMQQERLRWMSNKNPVTELYLNILKYSEPIEQFIREEIFRDKVVVRTYKIYLDGKSQYDSYFNLQG